MFFREQGGVWHPRRGDPVFPLQDPFFSRIHGELVVGGVETFPDPAKPGMVNWRTRFYRGRDVRTLEPFASGPDGMKDIRLVELSDGRIGVFTRPQGEVGGRGIIGYTEIGSLDELTADAILSAKLLTEQFHPDEWGGVNEAHLLANGLIGVLGHIAHYDAQMNKHYYPMVFAYDPRTHTGRRWRSSPCGRISRRAQPSTRAWPTSSSAAGWSAKETAWPSSTWASATPKPTASCSRTPSASLRRFEAPGREAPPARGRWRMLSLVPCVRAGPARRGHAFWSLAQVSFSETVRLNTSRSGVESRSTQK